MRRGGDLERHRRLSGPFRADSPGPEHRRLRAPFHAAGGGDGPGGQHQPRAQRGGAGENGTAAGPGDGPGLPGYEHRWPAVPLPGQRPPHRQAHPHPVRQFWRDEAPAQGGARPGPGVADHAHTGKPGQGVFLLPADQRPPVRQNPEDLGPVRGAFRAGPRRFAGLPGVCRAGQQPPVQGRYALPGAGHQFSHLVGRHRQPTVRGAAVHQRTHRQRVR